MRNYLFKADTSEATNFVESLHNNTDLFERVPKDFIFMRLKNLITRKRVPTTQAGEIVVAFGIIGTPEAFFTETLRAFHCKRLIHDFSPSNIDT